jgi:hypothetical protein
VLEKNEEQNPGAVQSFRKECRIRKSPELIFPKKDLFDPRTHMWGL